MRMADRRKPTEDELKDAQRLKAAYAKAKARAQENGRPFNQEIIADRLGWSGQSPVSQYLNGRIPLGLDALLKLSRELGVDPAEISPRLAKEIAGKSGHENTTNLIYPQTMIPLISWVQAGNWSEVVDLRSVDEEQRWEPCPASHSGYAFALKVRGESMYDPSGPASFSDGDIIHVDPKRQPENKSLVVVHCNSETEATFKQLIIEGDQYMLKALNPSWPDRIKKMPEDAEICGVVIGRYTPF